MARRSRKERLVEGLDKCTEEAIIERLAIVLTGSILQLVEPCIEQRCKQWLTFLHERDYLTPPTKTKGK